MKLDDGSHHGFAPSGGASPVSSGTKAVPTRTDVLIDTLRAFEAPFINAARGRKPILWETAQGATVTDVEGRSYIDLTASFGAAAIGHRHPRVVAAIKNQADRLLLALGDLHAHPLRAELARRLALFVPLDDAMVYFAMTGAEAVEIALKTAILKTGRSDILVFDPSYHGCTMAALSASSRQSFRAPFADHLSDRMHRLPFGCLADDIAGLLRSRPFAAALVEPIVGREGVIFPPEGWLRMLEQQCHAHGALLIVDEVLTGFGRTGTWFAFQREGAHPDIVCCGKALGGGVPIAAVLAPRDVMMAWEAPGACIHTTTFLANPLACAAALATLDVMEEEGLPARAERLGAMVGAFFEQLRGDLAERLSDRGAAITDIRGRGLLWRVETSPPALARDWAEIALDNGVIMLSSGGILRVSPPILVSPEQLTQAFSILRASLAAALDRLE